MEKRQRLIGIDLFRGLAIYSVVIVHIGGGIPVLPPMWLQIYKFALFAVPFFLATAFYLATSKLYHSQNPYPLRSRLTRLLIPYSCWSAFYVFYYVAKYGILGQTSRAFNVFHNPLSLFFFGGAAFHLYFLPLLATGTLLLKFSEFLIKKKVSLKALVFICMISFLLYETLIISGNSYKLGTDIAFQALQSTVFPIGSSNPLLRFILVEIAFILRCLPYVLIAMLINHPDSRKILPLIDKYPILWISIFLICNIFGSLILPQAIYEVTRGYTALIAAIALSSSFKDNNVIENLGLCAFGIYCIHLLFVEMFQSVAVRIDPSYIHHINTATLLFASVVIFIISWLITSLLMKSKNLSRFLFG